MKRTTLVVLLFMVGWMAAGCQPAATLAPTLAPTVADVPTVLPTEPAPVVLDVTANEKTLTFTLDDLMKLPATEGLAGIKSSTGKITPPTTFKGVLLTDLLEQVGGLDASMGVEIEAEDGYAMTFSADQIVKGSFIAYDPGTGDETQNAGTLQVLVAYQMEGKPLDPQRDGTLRLVVINDKNNQVTDGHWSVKWVRKVTVKPMSEEWTLKLEGAITDEIDRGSFESCSTGKCHPSSFTDDKAQTWTGTPLWMFVARVDDELKHETGAFNRDLAAKGYTVEVVARDGYAVIFDIARLSLNNEIILANQVNGNMLTEDDFPLRVVGPGLGQKESIGSVDRIIVHLDQKPESTKAPAAAPEATAAPSGAIPAGDFAIGGLVETPQGWAVDDLRGMEMVKLTVEHPKKGKQEVEGVRLSALLDWVKVKTEAKSLLFTAADGFTAEADLAAVRACADCMVAFETDGTLKLAMPGMESSFWVKDIRQIEIR